MKADGSAVLPNIAVDIRPHAAFVESFIRASMSGITAWSICTRPSVPRNGIGVIMSFRLYSAKFDPLSTDGWLN